MADYFTQFSTTLDLHTVENAERAMEWLESYEEELEGEDEALGFEYELQRADGSSEETMLLLYAESDGSPSNAAAWVLKFGKALGMKGRWGFCWANSCSRPVINSFGGGAVVIDFEQDRALYLNTATWAEDHGVNFPV